VVLDRDPSVGKDVKDLQLKMDLDHTTTRDQVNARIKANRDQDLTGIPPEFVELVHEGDVYARLDRVMTEIRNPKPEAPPIDPDFLLTAGVRW